MADAERGRSPVDVVISALEQRSCRVRLSKGKWSSQCPVPTHGARRGDKGPSLSVSESENGSALLYCHAGCTTAEVCHTIGLSLADLFPPKPPKVTHIGPSGRFKASYTYTDEDGEALFRVVRYEPKTFRQQRPDGKGGWVNGVEGIRRVPYHLPQLRKAIAEGKTIWIVEGEKDAENAEWFVPGIIATCNAMGAGKWRDEHARELYGAAKIVIVADNDRAGHEHARHIARTLVDHVGRVIIVLPAAGKDLTDHFNAQKDLHDFITAWDMLNPSDWLDGAAPDESLGEDTDDLPKQIDWDGFWKRENGPEWLVENFIPIGRHVVLYAPAKEGKSLLALEVAVAAATGRAVLGNLACEPLSVVYLDLEMTEDDLQERLLDMGYDETSDLSNLHYYSLPDLPPLDTKEGGDVVEAIVRSHDARLIVIDTMARVVQGEENSADTYRWFDMHTSLRLKAMHVAVLRLDHAGKDVAKGQRGSSEKVGYADVVWQLKYDPTTAVVTLKATHRRLGWVPEMLTLSRIEDPALTHQMAAGDGFTSEDLAVARELDDLGLPLDVTRRAAEKALRTAGMGRRSNVVSAALKARRKGAQGSGTKPGTKVSDEAQEPRSEPEDTNTSDLREPTPEPTGTTSGAPDGNHPHPDRDAVDPGVPDPDDPDSEELF